MSLVTRNSVQWWWWGERETTNQQTKKYVICEMMINALLKIKQSKRKREDVGGPGKEGILIWYRDMKKSGEAM